MPIIMPRKPGQTARFYTTHIGGSLTENSAETDTRSSPTYTMPITAGATQSFPLTPIAPPMLSVSFNGARPAHALNNLNFRGNKKKKDKVKLSM